MFCAIAEVHNMEITWHTPGCAEIYDAVFISKFYSVQSRKTKLYIDSQVRFSSQRTSCKKRPPALRRPFTTQMRVLQCKLQYEKIT